METSVVIGIIILVGGTLLVILYPLWQQTNPKAIFQTNHSGQTLEEYQARYQALLAAIKDLMFDHEMGKVAPEDYEILLTKTKLEAAAIRQHIDQLNHTSVPQPNTKLDTEIETQIAQLRNGHKLDNDTLLQEVNTEIELLKNVRPALEAKFCHICGNAIQSDDVFCAQCGANLGRRLSA